MAKEVKSDEVEVVERTIEHLDPAEVLADKNTRFGLLKSRVEELKDSIIEEGGITSPVEVEPLSDEEAKKNPGKAYRLTFGHYRLAALIAANKEGHNFTLPAMIVEIGDPVLRIRRQLSENMRRQDQTPIDKAYAIKALFDLGVSRMEIREIFTTPGGRKGMKAQPASNSFINMTMSFLDLGKKIQNMIHEGDIGVADAYYLTKIVDPIKRDQAVEAAISARLKQESEAEADENKFLDAEKKRLEAEAKLKEDAEKVKQVKAELDAAQEEFKKQSAESLTKYKEKMEAVDAEKKKEAEASHKAAEAAAKASQKLVEEKQKELEKAAEKAKKQEEAAANRAAKLEEAKKAAVAASKGKAPSKQAPLQVKKTAKQSDVAKKQSEAMADRSKKPNNHGNPLSHETCKKVLKDLSLPGSNYPKVGRIAAAIYDCFIGGQTDVQLRENLAIITGEKKEAKK